MYRRAPLSGFRLACTILLWGAAARNAGASPEMTLRLVPGTRDVRDVAQVADGTIWFINKDRLCRYDGSTVDCLLLRVLPRKLLPVPSGELLVASESPNALTTVVDGRVGSQVPLDSDVSGPENPVTALCWWWNKAWVAIGSRLRPVGGGESIDFNSPIVAAAAKIDGALHVATQKGAFRLEEPTGTPVPLQGEDFDGQVVTSLSFGASAAPWVGTTRGLWHEGRVVPQNSQIEGSFPLRNVAAVFADRDGVVWVASLAGLIQLRIADPIRVFASAEGMGGEIPFGIFAANDKEVWLTQNNGVGTWNGENFSRFATASGFDKIDLRTVAPGSNGNIWVGGIRSGLWELVEGRARKVALPPGYESSGIRTLLSRPDGGLWMGFETGGLALRAKDGVTRMIDFQAHRKPALVGPIQVQGETLWVAFRNGGFGAIHGGEWKPVIHPLIDQLPVASIAVQTPEQTVWLGTLGGGLFRYRDGHLTAITKLHGLPSDFIHSISIDRRNRLWAGTDVGVFSVSLEQIAAVSSGRKEPLRVTLYDERDGMRSAETVSSFFPPSAMTASGMLWQPTVNGVAVFDTDRLPPEVTVPRLAITEVTVGGRAVAQAQKAVAVGNGTFEARLVAATYRYPHRVAILFRFRRTEDAPTNGLWVPVAETRKLSLSGLAPGSYIIEARAYSTDDPAMISETFRMLTLTPPFYRTVPFYLASVSFVLLATAWRYRARVVALRRGYDIVLAERRRIARDMHDSLQQDLVGLKFHIETALITNDVTGGSRAHLEKAAELAAEGVRDLREAISGLAAETVSIAGLEERIEAQVKRLFTGTSLRAEVQRQGPSAKLSVLVATAVLQITREAITNVIKHAGAQNLKIFLDCKGPTLAVRIEDDGRGFSGNSAAETGGAGWRNMRSRAEEAKIGLEVNGSEGQGCRVQMLVPIVREQE